MYFPTEIKSTQLNSLPLKKVSIPDCDCLSAENRVPQIHTQRHSWAQEPLQLPFLQMQCRLSATIHNHGHSSVSECTSGLKKHLEQIVNIYRYRLPISQIIGRTEIVVCVQRDVGGTRWKRRRPVSTELLRWQPISISCNPRTSASISLNSAITWSRRTLSEVSKPTRQSQLAAD